MKNQGKSSKQLASTLCTWLVLVGGQDSPISIKSYIPVLVACIPQFIAGILQAFPQFPMSCVLNVLYRGTKQGKAYAAAYALLTRAHVLLTHAVVPYASLTLPNFSTSPQFRLTRSNFYMQELEQ